MKDQASRDHGVSQALYLRDPDGKGVELYWDRPRDQWPRDRQGGMKMHTGPLDVHALLSEAPARGERIGVARRYGRSRA